MAYGIVLNSFSRYLQSSFYSRDSKWRKALTWSVVRGDFGLFGARRLTRSQ